MKYFLLFFLNDLCVAGMHSMMLYQIINEKIENLTNMFAKAFYQLYFCLVVPYLVYTMVDYYFIDSVEKSFYFFYPTWFVYTYAEMTNSTALKLNFKLVNCSVECAQKVAVWLENTVGIFSGMDWTMCRSWNYHHHSHHVFQYCFRIEMAFHDDCWRYYKRFGCIQQWCGQNASG